MWNTFIRVPWLTALGVAMALPAAAQGSAELTLDEAMRLARRQSPVAAVASARISEAEAAVAAAAVIRTNPSIGIAAGPRFAADETSLDVGVSLSQPLVPGAPRARRIDLAEARVEVVRAEARDAERLLLGEVGETFARLLYWQERADLEARNVALLDEVERVAVRRHDVGDVGALDASRAAVARSHAQTASARVEAALVNERERLAYLLGVPADPLAVTGELATLAKAPPGEGGERPDVAARRAEASAEEARGALARTARVPRLEVGAEGEREESATILRGALSATLPLFDHGQGEIESAAAAASRAREEAEAARSRWAFEVRAADAEVAILARAAARFEDEALPTLREAERVATASYDAGAISLPDLLDVRRELLEAHRDHLELKLQLALARIEARTRRGTW